jgi:hypothetical protein
MDGQLIGLILVGAIVVAIAAILAVVAMAPPTVRPRLLEEELVGTGYPTIAGEGSSVVDWPGNDILGLLAAQPPAGDGDPTA